ncbi:MAG: DUF5119 domain-containing protein [Bacteroides sp.]|nr:DUF5119 domain-containing protein [Bacteroides sp.]
MGHVRYGWLLPLLGLLASLSGCGFREMLDDYPVSGVQITLDWTGVTKELPETMRVIFYPKDAEGRKVESYLSATGGEVKVPPGNYAVVIYNFNTETVQIRGEENYETIEAFTGHCAGLSTTEDMVWSPDPLYVVALDDVEIEKSDVALQMELKPEAAVTNYSFDIKIEGLERVSEVICNVDGLCGCYFLGKQTCGLCEAPIRVDTKYEGDVLWGYFSHFVLRQQAQTRANAPMMLILKLVKRDNTVQEIKVDVTELITSSLPTEDGLGTDSEVHIEVPVPDGEIVVGELEPGINEGGGGIGGDVGDWDDETNIELPV